MKNIKITPPEGYAIDQEKSTFENIVFKEVADIYDKMKEVFDFHKIKKEEFLSVYGKLESDEIGFKLEKMVANFYNKGEKVDFNKKRYYAVSN